MNASVGMHCTWVPGPGARVLVFDGGGLVGIVSPADVARVLAVADLHAARR